MRGPGPKTLSKIGEMLRVETEGVAQEPIPDRWLELIQAIEINRHRAQAHLVKGAIAAARAGSRNGKDDAARMSSDAQPNHI